METQVDRIMKNLRCSREEAEAILAEDKRIDRGEKVDFDLTDEQHKQAMKNANAGTRTAKEGKTARKAPENPTKEDFSHGNPFNHGSCMGRKAVFDAMGGYSEDPRVVRVEDYHLWIRMYEAGYRGMNLQEPLYDLRSDLAATGRRRLKARLNEAYVTGTAISRLKLPVWRYLLTLRPILLGLLPRKFYLKLHKKKLGL